MLQIDSVINGDTARLIFKGRFEFNFHREFRQASEAVLAAQGIREIVVDLGHVDYLDSSALGMLLQLHGKCQEKRIEVVLANCRGIVSDILKIAKFEKLFAIR